MIFQKKIDFWLIKFPIIFPTIYLSILFFFPEYENFLIFFTILLLAEPHFGATWTIFFNKINFDHYNSNKNKFYYGTILVLSFSLVGFFLFKNLFFLIFYAFNIFHVTKQSTGICKLYNKNHDEVNFDLKVIYFFNLLFFCIGLFRFYIPILSHNHILILNSLVLTSLALSTLYQYIKFRSLENALTTLTGAIIFFPICFVENPVHAILAGVTMHYSQYILITAKVYFGRKNSLNLFIPSKFIQLLKTKYFIVIFLYGILMALLSAFGKLNNDILKNLIIIPILFQMLHFYLDSFLWKFSEKHNREATLSYLNQKI